VFRGGDHGPRDPPLRTPDVSRAKAEAKVTLPVTPVKGMSIGKPIGLDLKRQQPDEFVMRGDQASPRRVELREPSSWKVPAAVDAQTRENHPGKGKGKSRRRRGKQRNFGLDLGSRQRQQRSMMQLR